MENKRGYGFLLYICIAILTCLASIQCYLLVKTYELNLTNYQSQVQSSVMKSYGSPSVQKINKRYLNNLVEVAGQLSAGKIDRSEFKRILDQKDKKVMNSLDSILKINLAENGLAGHVSFRTGYSEIVIRSAKKPPIILRFTDQEKILSQPKTKGFKVISLGQNNGNIDHIGTNTLAITYNNLIFFEMPSTAISAFEQMALVGMLSLALLFAVVAVFYRVFRSAQRQQKITELREDLVNNITHELKTPLTSMAIVFKTLQLNTYENNRPKQLELIDNLERQHRKLTLTVERVFESAVKISNRELERIDITTLLSEYRINILSNSHQIKIVFDDIPQYVLGRRDLIEAVLDNLLENAKKYSPEGSLIQLTGLKEKDGYRIDVIDQGVGIDPGYHKYLFEKFFRVPQNLLHAVKGLGLGLYLSRKSLRSIGGELKLTDSNEYGSIFSIYLTLA